MSNTREEQGGLGKIKLSLDLPPMTNCWMGSGKKMKINLLRILLKQDTALLSHVRVLVR